MSLEAGEIISDYEVLGLLGQGGMGAVYRVRNLISHREEAMKVIVRAESDPHAQERFLREIRVQASLRHPHIAELRTAVRVGDRILMVLELIDGESLSAKLKKGPIRFEAAVRIIDEVLSALDYAHRKGVVHRDIKPGNIMMTAGGLTKLMDFGIARSTNEDRITATSALVGSLHYMSPEQIRSNAADERSDLYSLGVTFYEMLTGRLPVDGQTSYELMHAHMTVVPEPPANLVPGLPIPISDAVMKALAKSPGERYATARAFRTALRDAVSGERSTATVITYAETFPGAELQRIEKRLTAALGPIAKSLVSKAASRHSSIRPLYHELAGQIADPKDRESFLRDFGFGAAATAASAGSRSGSRSDTRLSAETLQAAGKALAEYLGPMARIVVSRAANRAGSIDELREALAAEIPKESDRKAFRNRFKL